MQLPRRVPSDIHYDPFDDGVLAQESNTVSVTSLPDTPSTSSAPLDGKNNSIDVQRLQKNIDNWTIQVKNFNKRSYLKLFIKKLLIFFIVIT